MTAPTCLHCRALITRGFVRVQLSHGIADPGHAALVFADRDPSFTATAVLCGECADEPMAITHIFQLAARQAERAKGVPHGSDPVRAGE